MGIDTINRIYKMVLKDGYDELAQEKTLDGYYKIYYVTNEPGPLLYQSYVEWNQIGYLRPDK